MRGSGRMSVARRRRRPVRLDPMAWVTRCSVDLPGLYVGRTILAGICLTVWNALGSTETGFVGLYLLSASLV